MGKKTKATRRLEQALAKLEAEKVIAKAATPTEAAYEWVKVKQTRVGYAPQPDTPSLYIEVPAAIYMEITPL